MKVKNPEWIKFKNKFLAMIDILGSEVECFDLPDDTENFEIYVYGCVVHPTFQKKPEELRIHYDFTLCDTKIRTLSLSMYKDAGRIEMTLKNEVEIKSSL